MRKLAGNALRYLDPLSPLLTKRPLTVMIMSVMVVMIIMVMVTTSCS